MRIKRGIGLKPIGKKCMDWLTALGGLTITLIGLVAAIAGITIPIAGQIIMGIVAVVFAIWGIGRIANFWYGGVL